MASHADSRSRVCPTDQVLDDAISEACKAFGVTDVHVEQRIAISCLLRGRDVFACFPAGYGKSLVYQILPLVSKLATPAVCPDGPIVIVVSPLRSLMRDQVLSLQGKGTRAFQVGWCVQDDDCIKNGDCSVFFGTPEVLLGTEEWRSSLQTSPLKDRLIAIAVDEVHTVTQW